MMIHTQDPSSPYYYHYYIPFWIVNYMTPFLSCIWIDIFLLLSTSSYLNSIPPLPLSTPFLLRIECLSTGKYECVCVLVDESRRRETRQVNNHFSLGREIEVDSLRKEEVSIPDKNKPHFPSDLTRETSSAFLIIGDLPVDVWDVDVGKRRGFETMTHCSGVTH
jgi:hypothetical protein